MLAWPLPPFGGLLATRDWPFFPSAEAVVVGENHPDSGVTLPWATLQLRREQRLVYLGADICLPCPSAECAEGLLSSLKHLRDASATERKELISNWWTTSLDVEAASAELDRYRLMCAKLRPWCLWVWLLAFMVVPGCFWWYGPSSWWTWSSSAMLVMGQLMLALLSRRLSRSGWLEFFHLLLVPPYAMRAMDHLSITLFAEHHSLALGKLLLTDALWRVQASKVYRSWKFMGKHEALHNARDQVLPHLEAFFLSHGIQLEELNPVPPRPKDESQSYCPRCHANFTLRETSCADCGGVQTQMWA